MATHSGLKDYEDYTVTSQDYDKYRTAVGPEVVLGALTYSTGKPAKELHVLDAGCGTGNYTVALSKYFGKMTGLDRNEGMLLQLKQKMLIPRNVEVKCGNILAMPFPDASFDGVTCNQVIHHLIPEDASGFENVGVFVKEAYRVVTSGGALIINTCTPEQVLDGHWSGNLIPEASKKVAKRYPTIAMMENFLKQAGFTIGPVLSNTRETVLREDAWLDKDGPFKPEWRNADSTWALATPEELESALKFWRQTVDEGKGEEYIAKFEEKRKQIGSSVFIVGYKH